MASKKSARKPAKKSAKKATPKKAAPKKAAAKKPAKTKKKRKSKKNKEYYVSPKEFKANIVSYYHSGEEMITDYLGETVYKIAVGLSYAPNFINYTYKEDMIGDAILKMLAALREKKFNIDSEYNPFSYFTTIAFHAFVNRIKKEKRYRETIDNYQQEYYAANLSSEDGPSIYVSPDDEDSDGNYNVST